MVFIRKKNINGKDYAYLVRNKWTNKGSRQKAKYLGKLLKFDVVNEMTFEEFVNRKYNIGAEEFIKSNNKEGIISDLIEFELAKRGFVFSEIKVGDKKSRVLNNGKYFLDRSRILKISTQKEGIVELNEGFLCSYSLAKLLELKPQGYDEREKGIQLAKYLLESGLKVEHELFVALFEKWDRT